MSRFTPELYARCRNILLRCDEFGSNESLRALFITDDLSPFKFGLPIARSQAELVDLCLEYLVRKQLNNGNPLLIAFLGVLCNRCHPEDVLYGELKELFNILSSIKSWTQTLATDATNTPSSNSLFFDGSTLDLLQIPLIPSIEFFQSSEPETIEKPKAADARTAYKSSTQHKRINGNYIQLRKLLEAKDWREADLETTRLILRIAEREENGWLRTKDIETFSCSDLRTIDNLWKRFSLDNFGFSIQRSIWLSINGQPGKYDSNLFPKFCERVGWLVNDKWLEYDALSFTSDAPIGHLPSLRLTTIKVEDWLRPLKDNFKSFLALVETCL